jgi:hypothetical protein
MYHVNPKWNVSARFGKIQNFINNPSSVLELLCTCMYGCTNKIKIIAQFLLILVTNAQEMSQIKFCRSQRNLRINLFLLFSLALQLSAGYGLLWLCSPARAMASCGSAAQRGLWPPRSRGFLNTHNDAPKSVWLLWTSDQLVAELSTWQHTTHTTDKYPCPRWDSNPRSQQASGRRPTP